MTYLLLLMMHNVPMHQCIQMGFLDLSSAFDNINHDIIINRLYN